MGFAMRFWKEISLNRWLYALALPAFLLIFVFSYLPLQGHIIAFKDFNAIKGVWGSDWVGLDNIKFFFMGGDWKLIIYNTIFLNVLFIVFGTIMALVVAILLNEIRLKWFKKVSQTLVILPHFISFMVVYMMVQQLFNSQNGYVNQILGKFGLEGFAWNQSPELWPTILTIIMVWKSAGWGSIIYLATMAGFSEEYYESARIDGASRIQQIWGITLPLLRPTIIILTLLSLGGIFHGNFALIYGIIGDNALLYPTTDVIDTYTYRALRFNGQYGMSGAIALMQSLLGFVTILFFNWLTGKIDKESKLF